MSDLVLVVGLGNPGDRYVGTRHNVGFDVVDALAERLSDVPGRPVRVDRLDCRALTARVRLAGQPVLLAKPQTYMNLSGESVKGLVVKHEIPLPKVMVVGDDVALPVGRLRIRPSGSSAGQKGLQNVLQCLGTNDVPRLRIGIAGEHFRAGEDKADYVLERFSKSERALVASAIAEACDAVEVWLAEGIDVAMTRFNRTDRPEGDPRSLAGPEGPRSNRTDRPEGDPRSLAGPEGPRSKSRAPEAVSGAESNLGSARERSLAGQPPAIRKEDPCP